MIACDKHCNFALKQYEKIFIFAIAKQKKNKATTR